MDLKEEQQHDRPEVSIIKYNFLGLFCLCTLSISHNFERERKKSTFRHTQKPGVDVKAQLLIIAQRFNDLECDNRNQENTKMEI